MLFVNRGTRNTGAELPVELGTRPGPVTKIRYRWVCERPVDLILNLVTLSGVTICIYPAEPMVLSVQIEKEIQLYSVHEDVQFKLCTHESVDRATPSCLLKFSRSLCSCVLS